MRDFFNPWRRKIGVVTLGLALLFMGIWMRSYAHCDEVAIRWSPSSDVLIGTCRDGLLFKFSPNVDSSKPNLVMKSYAREANWPEDPVDWWLPTCQIRPTTFQLCGLRYCNAIGSISSGTVTFKLWIISYWWAIAPITLLSAYLLLSKPRPAPKSELSTPRDHEHA